MPPLLIPESIGPTVEGLIEAREALEPRLHLEFPGFADDFSITVGRMALEGAADPPERPVAYVAATGRYVAGEAALDLAAVLLDGQGERPAWAEARMAAMDADGLAVLRRVASQTAV
jgi:hypothetical protein